MMLLVSESNRVVLFNLTTQAIHQQIHLSSPVVTCVRKGDIFVLQESGQVNQYSYESGLLKEVQSW